MRLVTFDTGAGPDLGVIDGDLVVRPAAALRAREVYHGGLGAASRAEELPEEMVAFFQTGAQGRALAAEALAVVSEHSAKGDELRDGGRPVAYPLADVRLLAPVPRPPRVRDYLTYRAHASGSGLATPPALAAMPICYQCNANSIIGPDETLLWPSYTGQLDFELEIGFFTSQGGRDLTPDQAADHIAGVTIFNDVSARDIQFFEMSMSIGPSKGKDFCTSMGPCVLTMDEVSEWDIELSARVNGETWTTGTTADRQFSFAEVLAWASLDEDVQPGEFLAVGTVGGGCGLELDRWIQPGDVVELEASGIGILRNPVGERCVPPPGAGLRTYEGAPSVRPHVDVARNPSL